MVQPQARYLDADADDVFTDDEIFWSAAMLIGAGSETTTNMLSGLLLTLAQQPDLYARLREHPELIPAAIEGSCAWSPGARVLQHRNPRLHRRGKHHLPLELIPAKGA